ncbi:sugar porter family MFS transporter [Sulfuracidifex tepidarius]|uniref:Sialic acid transporter n=1 Tax=Sulfuracidifex tepidarius TaxID=1294262 RepID=A0A510E343_9CREN|nr:sugar porter family MFS transporter [Sulfuracidifex tepidarius]BBG26906.1 Putative sialic acid transporter [Sulfuracidifex tepidarius]
MAQPKERDVIIEKLDSHSTTSIYWSLTILATIGGFLFGYDTSNIGSALDLMKSVFPGLSSPLVEGYLVAGASLGAAVGAIIAGPVTDKFGRKSMLIADAAIYAIGAIVSAFTVNVPMILVARTFIGLAIGADSGIATAYIAEYAPKSRRGSLSILQQWMITIGILSAYLVGLATLYILPSYAFSLDWRIMLGVAAIPALIGLAFRFRMPESPRWLIENGKFSKLKSDLSKLGIEVSEDDLKGIKLPRKGKITPGIKRALLIAGLFMVFQQITGINIPFYYGPTILSKYFSASGEVSTIEVGIMATTVLAIINVAATYIGFKYIDSYGRKSIARLGYAGMAVFMILGIASFILTSGIIKTVGLMVAFSGFIIFFAFGVGGTGWLIQGEYFPTEVRGRMAATVAFIDWIANFAITEIFPVMDSSVGLGVSMGIFALLSIVAVVFVMTSVPETKGLSVEEIAEMFEKKASS